MNGKKSMDRYENMGTVGEGSYGVVTKCKDKTNGLVVAIKKFLESDTDKAVKKIATREIKILKTLRHDNLVNLIEVFRRNKRIYLVFEFIEHNLLEEIEKTSSGLGESRTKEVMYQVCRGVDFMHTNNFIHRDLKPENVLINKHGLIKVCDFGFARQIASSSETYTDYVATRWYRSPELLVGDPRYGKPVDVWSLGTLAYEVLTSKPLFPGESDLDQLYLIINSLGDLPDSMKSCFQQNHFYMNAKFPRMKNYNPLQNKLKKYSNNMIKFVHDALSVDVSKRSTSSELLRHELFLTNNWVEDFSSKLKNIVSIYESSISRSLASKNKTAKKTSQQSIVSTSKFAHQKQIDKQNEINRINELNKQIEIAKLKEISKFIIQSEIAAPPITYSNSYNNINSNGNSNTNQSNQNAYSSTNPSNSYGNSNSINNDDMNHSNCSSDDVVIYGHQSNNNNNTNNVINNENKAYVNNHFSNSNNTNIVNNFPEHSFIFKQQKNQANTDVNSTATIAKNSFNNLSNLNGNTKLPKIESVMEHSIDNTSLKNSNNSNGNTSRQATSPTNIILTSTNNNNLNNVKISNTDKLKHHSNSIEVSDNLKCNSILSMGQTSMSLKNNELASNSLTNTNKLNTNLNSNSSFFGSSNVFILEETYKLNGNQNGNHSNNGLSKNNLKRQNEIKSNSKIEGAFNLPQVKQIELYSKTNKTNVYEKNPFLMPINKK